MFKDVRPDPRGWVNLRTHTKGRGMEWEGFLYGLTLRGTEAPLSVAVHPSVVQRTGVAGNGGAQGTC